MPLFTNPYFASASAGGTDWRDTARAVLEQLQEAITDHSDFTLGLMHVTDVLSNDLNSILTLFKTVTKVETWCSSIGIGVFDCENIYLEEPGISVMLLKVPESQFCPFHFGALNRAQETPSLEKWLQKNETMLVLANAETVNGSLSVRLQELENLVGGFLVGGVASSRVPLDQQEEERCHGDLRGVAFSNTVSVAATLTQGCKPIGPMHTVTACEGDYIIRELDHLSSYEVFQSDLREMAIQEMGADPQKIELQKVVDEAYIQEEIPPELQTYFQGEVHVAFPIQGSDQRDYLVRNILGFDHEQGLIAVGQTVHNGDRVMFVHRNQQTMREDLYQKLLDLRARVEEEQGVFMPKGAIYISCAARAGYDLSQQQTNQSELSLIREILGPVPLTGFYAGGEILKGKIYGYTGILILFL